MGIIKSEGWSPEVEGVDSGLDSMGRGHAKPLDNHESGRADVIDGQGWAPEVSGASSKAVRVSYSLDEVEGLSSGPSFSIDSVRD